ncbi:MULTISPECIES: FCD domain-containing protein [unclassified Microbispora]|uniref:FCD domain-containing protein n=1 Tax=unclassified Microbispora TaxID=2614687 RepID=UPI0016044CC2|nr:MULTISPECIES: FCD domain-containing protein [unclassified Microbispora]
MSDVPNPISSHLSHQELLLLDIVAESADPVGARIATRRLGDCGIALSEASTSRLLARLDDLGLTVSSGRKGRTVTDAGRRVAQVTRRTRRQAKGLHQALDIQNARQLLDLLYARRGVEREAARWAATRATPDDIERLEALVDGHREALDAGGDARLCGMRFHREIFRISRNGLLQAIGDVVLDESLEPLELVLDVITGGHGTLAQSAPEHVDVLAAIRARDPDEAEQTMLAHVDRLIEEAERAATDRGADVVKRLIELTL